MLGSPLTLSPGVHNHRMGNVSVQICVLFHINSHLDWEAKEVRQCHVCAVPCSTDKGNNHQGELRDGWMGLS